MLAAWALAGCTSSAVRGLERAAAEAGFFAATVQGQGFRHRVYANRAPGETTPCLRVYLEGDGTPWLAPGRPALDPTSRNPLALRLMALDPGAALYLGRPCYGGLSADPGCGPWHWTHGRYAEPVVASLAAALERVAARRRAECLVLVGYSGGGTLAMLLAERVDGVRGLVTLAANLDVEAWTRLHDYSPMTGSLNPADRPPLPRDIRQRHWAGERDRNVPPELVRGALAHQPGARLRVLDGADHRSGWEALWRRLLAEEGGH